MTQFFIVAATRPDGTAPKLVKALHDKMFYELREAQEFAREKAQEYACELGVYEVEADVGKEVERIGAQQETPFVAIGPDELQDAPFVRAGDMIVCSQCGQAHVLMASTSNGRPTEKLLAYKCGDQTYLAALDNRLLSGLKLAKLEAT